MLNQAVLKNVIANYKRDFELSRWENEKFKWQAVRHFQDHWDIEAEDFPEMLEQAMSKTFNLLASVNYFPLAMIKGYSKSAPEEMRALFRNLFDETKNVEDRIAQFKAQAAVIHEQYGNGANNHYQNENSISAYLWLRYPDKYCIYKYGETSKAAKILVSDYSFKKGAYAANIRNAFAFYDELSMELRKDEALISMLRSRLTDEEYPDAQCRTLAMDVGFYIAREYSEVKKDTYLTEIIESLKTLGGKAHLGAIHAEMEKRDRLQSIHTSATWKHEVSVTLQKHSSDTKSYTEGNEDVFYSVDGLGKGIWGLRNYQSDEEKTEQINTPDKYDRDNFLKEVFMSGENFDTLRLLLKQKKNIILQGAPGVGKTYTARRLAYAAMGVKDDSRIEMIQFHQNYSYEDFIMGYKPDGEGFRLTEGVFYRFCDRARHDPHRDYFFIIDEINRGNMSKIFGELLMLIEKPYRGTGMATAYAGKPFSVPDNLYIIGMMNTADRSLALIDYALRRRFSFFEMAPGFDTEGFEAYQKALDNDTFDHLIQYVRELNHAISRDAALGDGFRIGHSYFSNWDECTDDRMKLVAYYEILPMLKEYWFDDRQKVQDWENKLNGVFDD